MKINSGVQTKITNPPMTKPLKTTKKNSQLSEYFFNVMKNRKIISYFNNNIKVRIKKIYGNKKEVSLNVVNMKLNNVSFEIEQNTKNSFVLPKISLNNFKIFSNESTKNNSSQRLVKSFSSNDISNKNSPPKVNPGYISNKKSEIEDKYFFDNNKYLPNRIGVFDMSVLPEPKKKMEQIQSQIKKEKKRAGKVFHIRYNKFINCINNNFKEKKRESEKI